MQYYLPHFAIFKDMLLLLQLHSRLPTEHLTESVRIAEKLGSDKHNTTVHTLTIAAAVINLQPTDWLSNKYLFK